MREPPFLPASKGRLLVVNPNPYEPDKYQPQVLQAWIDTARRQAPKDRLLIPRIAGLLQPGPVLELGSAVGHLARLLRGLGHEVLASDYAPFFVEYMKQQGLPAVQIDATNIAAAGLQPYPNIFAQSISPFITTDLNIVASAYRSVLEALTPGGHFVLIHAMAPRRDLAQTMRDHQRLAREAGFEIFEFRRDQLLPTTVYARLPALAAPLDAALGPSLGSRFVLAGRRPR